MTALVRVMMNSLNMNNKWTASILLVTTMVVSGCSGNSKSTSSPSNAITYEGSPFEVVHTTCFEHLEIGSPSDTDQVLCREGYAVGYDYINKVADWVSYYLTSESVSVTRTRVDSFTEDVDVPDQFRSTLSDYSGSGYDRGHFAPNASMDFTASSMQESFLLTNISPQLLTFNRNGWAELEQVIRDCTVENGSLYVVTGTIYDSIDEEIGNGVEIPDKFYKAILKLDSPASAFALSIPHAPLNDEDLRKYVVSIDQLEKETGNDFFSNLKDNIEAGVESNSASFCSLPLAEPTSIPTPTTPQFSCGTKKYCYQMSSCSEAMFHFQSCGLSGLDGDKDGTPCESLCQ